MTRILLFALAAGFGGLLVVATADADWTDDAERCYALAYDARAGVEACTRAINSGQMRGADLGALYINRASSYLTLRLFDKSVADATRALEISPDDVYALNNRAIAYAGLEDLGPAMLDLERAAELDPDDAPTFNNQCWVLGLSGMYDTALTACNVGLALNATDAILLATRGDIYRLKGDFDLALADLDAAVELGPGMWETWLYRGHVHWDRGAHAAARSDYLKARGLAPTEPEVIDALQQSGFVPN